MSLRQELTGMKANMTFVDSRFLPNPNLWCALLILVADQNLVIIDGVVLAVSLSPLNIHCMNTRRHPQNRKYITYRTPPHGDRATTTGNKHKCLLKLGRVAFEICKQIYP